MYDPDESLRTTLYLKGRRGQREMYDSDESLKTTNVFPSLLDVLLVSKHICVFEVVSVHLHTNIYTRTLLKTSVRTTLRPPPRTEVSRVR